MTVECEAELTDALEALADEEFELEELEALAVVPPAVVEEDVTCSVTERGKVAELPLLFASPL